MSTSRARPVTSAQRPAVGYAGEAPSFSASMMPRQLTSISRRAGAPAYHRDPHLLLSTCPAITPHPSPVYLFRLLTFVSRFDSSSSVTRFAPHRIDIPSRLLERPSTQSSEPSTLVVPRSSSRLTPPCPRCVPPRLSGPWWRAASCTTQLPRLPTMGKLHSLPFTSSLC